MADRASILARVRETLSVKSDPHVRGLAGSGDRDPALARKHMPRAGTTPREHLETFLTRAERLRAEVILLADSGQIPETLRTLAEREGWTSLASHRSPLTVAADSLGLPVLWTDDGVAVEALETVSAGISTCEALIAQTGSVMVTNAGCGGRALSVLPPHHVVLASREHLVPDLYEGFQRLRQRYGSTFPSLVSFITGASRTGDIERILVLGAHGPKKLTILIVENQDHA